MDIDQPPASTSAPPLLVPLAASRNGRTPGKAHKSDKTATRRTFISPALKTPFEKRKEGEKRREAMRAVEREMKDEKAAEKERRRTVTKERRERQAEKQRLEQAAAKMSAKKLQRMRKVNLSLTNPGIRADSRCVKAGQRRSTDEPTIGSTTPSDVPCACMPSLVVTLSPYIPALQYPRNAIISCGDGSTHCDS